MQADTGTFLQASPYSGTRRTRFVAYPTNPVKPFKPRSFTVSRMARIAMRGESVDWLSYNRLEEEDCTEEQTNEEGTFAFASAGAQRHSRLCSEHSRPFTARRQLWPSEQRSAQRQ